MKPHYWDDAKNALLHRTRRVTFDDCWAAIGRGDVLAILGSANPVRYPQQQRYVIQFGNYAYVVPFVESDDAIFLKTIYPSRRMTALYLRQEE